MSATPIHFVRVFGNPTSKRIEARILCTGRKATSPSQRSEVPSEVTCGLCKAIIEKNGLPRRLPYHKP